MNKEPTPKMKKIKEQINNISGIKTLQDRTKAITKIKKSIHSERLLLEEYLESLEKIMHQVENPPDQNHDDNQETGQDKPDLESSESSESTNSTESSESSGSSKSSRSSKESKVSKESGDTVLSVKEKTMDVHSLASDIQKLKEQLDNTSDLSDRIELFDIIKKTRKCQEHYHNIKMEVVPVE